MRRLSCVCHHCVGMYPVYIYVYFCMNQQMTIKHILIWCRDQDLGPEYGPFRVLKFLPGIMEGPLCWEDKKCIRMVPWCTHVKMANHAKIVREIQIIISRASVTKREGRLLSKILFAVVQVILFVFSAVIVLCKLFCKICVRLMETNVKKIPHVEFWQIINGWMLYIYTYVCVYFCMNQQMTIQHF